MVLEGVLACPPITGYIRGYMMFWVWSIVPYVLILVALYTTIMLYTIYIIYNNIYYIYYIFYIYYPK